MNLIKLISFFGGACCSSVTNANSAQQIQQDYITHPRVFNATMFLHAIQPYLIRTLETIKITVLTPVLTINAHFLIGAAIVFALGMLIISYSQKTDQATRYGIFTLVFGFICMTIKDKLLIFATIQGIFLLGSFIYFLKRKDRDINKHILPLYLMVPATYAGCIAIPYIPYDYAFSACIISIFVILILIFLPLKRSRIKKLP